QIVRQSCYSTLVIWFGHWGHDKYSIHDFIALPIIRKCRILVVRPEPLFGAMDMIRRKCHWEAVVRCRCYDFPFSLLAFTLLEAYYTMSKKWSHNMRLTGQLNTAIMRKYWAQRILLCPKHSRDWRWKGTSPSPTKGTVRMASHPCHPRILQSCRD